MGDIQGSVQPTEELSNGTTSTTPVMDASSIPSAVTLALALDLDDALQMQPLPTTDLDPPPPNQLAANASLGLNHANAAPVVSLNGFTQTPQGGFPEIHGWNAENVFDGLDANLRELWALEPHPKFLAYPFPQGGLEDPVTTVGHIKLALGRAFPGSDAKVGYPVQSKLPHAPTPVCFMVAGLDDGQTQAAIAQRCFASEHCTFFTIPFSPDITDYVCTLERFTLEATEGHIVLTLLRDQLLRSEDVMHFICTYNDALEQRAYQDINEVLQIVADTARVTPLEMGVRGGGAKTVWRVYIKSPTQDIQAHERWVNIVSTLNYCTAFKGAGRPLLFSACNRCKSYDHPTGLCAFPHIPGWLGPRDDARLQPTTAVPQQPLTVGLSFLNPPLAIRNNRVSAQPAPAQSPARSTTQNGGYANNLSYRGRARGRGSHQRGRGRARGLRGYAAST